MKFHQTIGRTVFKIIVLIGIASPFFSACTYLLQATYIPSINTCSFFENETYLVTDSFLINKQLGTVTLLDYNTYATAPNALNVYYKGPYTYKCVFHESTFEQHVFLVTNYHDSESDKYIRQFQDTVFTFNYEGKELSRTYHGDPIPKDVFFEEIFPPSETLSFEIDLLYEFQRLEHVTPAQQTILDYAENIYETYPDPHYDVIGTIKPMENDLWFSITTSDVHHYNSGFALMQGIDSSKIIRYDPQGDDFETIFVYKKRKTVLLDFDEEGIYTFDINGNLKHYDFTSKKTTKIYTFPNEVSYFDVTDNYIGVFSEGKYLLYEKNVGILANSSI